ncbi:MAG: hypothetical protein MJZ00_06080 [Paludibacteraceae bacterium]|nr:hypothetical protein [Paludibacteraceae bacterium]
MFEDINKTYFLLAVVGITLLYLFIRRLKEKTRISISEPGKFLRDLGLLSIVDDGSLMELMLSNVELDKPVARVMSENENQPNVWILDGDLDDDFDSFDYRMRGYITPEGFIYKQFYKNDKPVLVGYTARLKEPNKPTIKGKRSWTSLWLESELYAFEVNPDGSIPDKPLTKRVGYACKSGIAFNGKRPVTFEAKACATALLYQKYGPKEKKNIIYREPVYGWNDTALLTAIVYSVIFMILYFTYTCMLNKPLLGNDFYAVFILYGCYYALWALIRQFKIDSIENSHSIQPHLDMLNKGLGLKRFDSAIAILCSIAAYYIYFFMDYDLLPLIGAVMYGISHNALANKIRRPWKIVTNFDEERNMNDESYEIMPFASMTPPSGEMVRVFDWDLDSSNGRKLHGNLTVHFSMDLYEQMRTENPFYSQDTQKSKHVRVAEMIHRMLNDHIYSERVRYIASYIINEANFAKLDEINRLQFALDFVQEPNIEYVQDRYSKSIQYAPEYMRYPDETLYDQEGDCDCKSLLAGMILYYMGYKVLFISSAIRQHTAIAIEFKENDWLSTVFSSYSSFENAIIVHNHRKYVYCETTGDGFRIGQLVDEMRVDDFETRIEIEKEEE